MTNIYDKIIGINPENVDIQSYLKSVDLYKIFEPVFDEFADIGLATNVIKFILYGYTPESELLMEKGGSWERIGKIIYSRLDLPEDHIESVMQLKSIAVQKAIQGWLFFQDEDNWANWCVFRDLRNQMLAHAISDVKDGENLDIKSKMDAAKYAKDLLEMMENAKSRFVQNQPNMNNSTEALKKVVKVKHTLGPQTFAH